VNLIIKGTSDPNISIHLSEWNKSVSRDSIKENIYKYLTLYQLKMPSATKKKTAASSKKKGSTAKGTKSAKKGKKSKSK
jgi:hypothetical protein